MGLLPGQLDSPIGLHTPGPLEQCYDVPVSAPDDNGPLDTEKEEINEEGDRGRNKQKGGEIQVTDAERDLLEYVGLSLVGNTVDHGFLDVLRML